MRRGIGRTLARDARRAVLGSIVCLVLAVLAGVGGFECFGHPGGSAGGSPSLPSLIARANQLPRAITVAPPALTTDPLVEPAYAHPAVARAQMLLAFHAAQERAAAEALRLEPRPLSVAPSKPADTPALTAGTSVSARVTFYYCQAGALGPTGDGGGFCGRMANGAVVHPGAAACARAYLGQRFRIVGDPTGRTYTCEDTGSAVHGMHRDIWFNTNDEGRHWQAVVGQMALIQILP